MKKKSIVALILAFSLSLGTAAMGGCNIIGGYNPDDNQHQTEDEKVAVKSVSLNTDTLALQEGGSERLTATVNPTNADNQAVSWSTDKPAIATVDQSGLVTAVAEGTAIITVTTADGGKTAACTVNVSKKAPAIVSVTGVVLDKSTATIKVDGTVTLKETVSPSNAKNKDVSWSSNKPAVATVDQNGVVTAVSVGTAVITVTTADGNHKASCTVTVEAKAPVNIPVSGVSLDYTSATLKVGATKQLTPTVSPVGATNQAVSWSSNKPNIATVSSGLVTAVAAGTATITVTTADGNKTATCQITVENNATKPVVDAKITYSYAGNECAAFEWADKNAASAKVEYKLHSENSYTALSGNDKAYLIRQANATTARVDLVGLKKNTSYDFKITSSSGDVMTVSDMTINAYDRSGYAHFGKTDGVGAYKDDGTVKSNAVVVYVTEDNKNTVTANGKTGLINILKSASASKPLIVRVVGTVGSATWNELKYNGGKAFSDPSLVKGVNNKQLPSDSTKLTQKYLSENGYNTLNYTPNDPFYTARTPDANGATCTVLSGIEETSKATRKVDSNGNVTEYDSCWNNVSLSGLENVTVEGIGEDARIFQWGFTWNSCNSIEVRNIKFDDYTEDACSFESGDFANGNGNYWVHNNTFEQGKNYWDVCPEQDKHEGDGATDFKRVRNITIAYNHYYKNHKTGLIGSGDDVLTANVTFHHNYYQQNSSRMPLGRQANMHMYNNYYYGSTGTNMSLRGNAFALIENCYFENANVPIELKSGAVAKIIGSVFTGKTPSVNSDLHIDTNESNLKRESKVANNNTVVGSGKYFDVDAALFYYDSTNKKSNVSVMFTAAETKSYVPQLAGVQKRGGNVTLGGTGSGGTGTGTETPDPNPGGETGTVNFLSQFDSSGKALEIDNTYFTVAGGKFKLNTTSTAILPNSDSTNSFTVTAKSNVKVVIKLAVSNGNAINTTDATVTVSSNNGTAYNSLTFSTNASKLNGQSVTLTLKAGEVVTFTTSGGRLNIMEISYTV
ncbi:MAG: Ig-like domain-containing protein [Clostridia bacterium]|nr:Ig-like domain-containing protein [Clostridia bacterium]